MFLRIAPKNLCNFRRFYSIIQFHQLNKLIFLLLIAFCFMEIFDTFNASSPLPYLAVVPAVALLFLFFKKRQRDKVKIRICPHCKQSIGMDETACSFCHRKISYA
jgi:hypothetical protein